MLEVLENIVESFDILDLISETQSHGFHYFAIDIFCWCEISLIFYIKCFLSYSAYLHKFTFKFKLIKNHTC